jgi:hypothetical protein
VHKIETFLTIRKPYDLVSGKEAPPTEQKALEKWDQRNKEAGAHIKICVSDEVFVEIKNLREGTKIWKVLKQLYHNTSESWMFFLCLLTCSELLAARLTCGLRNHNSGASKPSKSPWDRT